MKCNFKSILYISITLICSQFAHATDEINVYSARKEAYIKPLLDQFGQAHNVQINLITAKADALIQRLLKEGKNTPADVFITVDAGRLHRAKHAGLLQAIKDPAILSQVPHQYQDAGAQWVGLSVRARTLAYRHKNVKKEELSSYEALTDANWKNRICIRSSNNIYNQSLVASMLAHHGEQATQAWANGLVANFARKPQGGDRDQIKALAAGQCDLTVINTYYLGKMMTADAGQQAAASEATLFWANQDDRGVHVNVSGIGITAHSKHPELASKLVAFLLTDASQAWYGEINLEYPVRKGIEINDILQQWGPFKADALNLTRLGELNAEAVRIMDRAGWR